MSVNAPGVWPVALALRPIAFPELPAPGDSGTPGSSGPHSKQRGLRILSFLSPARVSTSLTPPERADTWPGHRSDREPCRAPAAQIRLVGRKLRECGPPRPAHALAGPL